MATANPPASFSEANIALHAKLLSALHTAAAATAAPTPVAANASFIAPTPLLTRVLRRTAVDFADVIVDGRCATGSRQVGSAAAIWVHHNAAVRSAGSANTSPATVAATAAGMSAAPSPASPAAATAAANTPAIVPLYHTEAALGECRNLMVVYSFHCLLTASQLYAQHATGASKELAAHPAADGRLHQIAANACYWTPEVALIVAETEASAEALFKLCKTLSDACDGTVQVTLVTGNKAPASLVLRPANATPATSSSAGKDGGDGAAAATKKKGTEWPCALSILIATAQNFLSWNLTTLLNTGVDVAIAEEGAEAESKESAVKVRRVFPHVTSVVVEEIAGTTLTAAVSVDKAIQQWRDVHMALSAAMPRQHPRYCAFPHLLPHFLWICRGPVSRLPPALRLLLSRRSRRYYQLLPSTYISSAAAALMPDPQEGLSTPAESLGIRLVSSQNNADKDAQLRRIVTDRSGLFHRVLILTHNKEVPQLNALLNSWGVQREYPANANTSSASEVAPNVAYSTRRMDSIAVQHQGQTAYLASCTAAEKAELSAGAGVSSPVVVSLVAWDAFTGLDLMDVDVVVQYYPPQKSLTEQEWAEYIQLLHTTVDGEREIELSLRQNRNNKEDNIRAKLAQLMQATTTGPEPPTDTAAAASSSSAGAARTTPQRPLPVLVTLMVMADFTLTAYFVHQYLYSGASGTLTSAAVANSLASITPAPGKPGVQEPVEHPLPVLDISPKHPYFIPLVCGHDGGAHWPESAAGSPPKPRLTPPGPKANDAPLLHTLLSGEPVTVNTVLAAKLAKEQLKGELSKSPGGGSSQATSPTAASSAVHGANGSTPSPVMLLAQGNVSLNGGNAGSALRSVTGNTAAGLGASGSDAASNLVRLVKNAGVMAASTSPIPNANSSGSSNNNNNQRQRGAGGGKDTGSIAEANNSGTSAGGNNNNKFGGNKNNTGNTGSNNKGNKDGSGAASVGNANANNSSTTSSITAATAQAGGASSDNQSPASVAAAAAGGGGKAAGGDKNSGSGGQKGKRRQRSGRGGNKNDGGNNSGSNANNTSSATTNASGNNNAKKPATAAAA